MRFSLKARVVFPVEAPPIESGVVNIDGSSLTSVGHKADSANVIDLGSAALLPGFVNAHTHLEFSYLGQPLGQPGMSLVDWIRIVIAERGRTKRSSRSDLEGGVAESHQFGVTTIGDITTGTESMPGDITYFHEVIGFSRARAESAFEALCQRLPNPSVNPNASQGISPHAPYTVSPMLLQRLVSKAHDLDYPMAMHLAESTEELQLLRNGTGPFKELLEERSMWDPEAIPRHSRPLDYLRLLAEAPRTLVVHGNYLEVDELEFLAAHRARMSLVYCPRTHSYFLHSPYPLSQAMGAGVRIAIGTDSRASNPDLSLLAEMRQIMKVHPHIDPHQVLRMGTLNGAEALGRDRIVGSISEHKLANLVAVPISDRQFARTDDILAEIFAAEALPSAVYLAGRPLNL